MSELIRITSASNEQLKTYAKLKAGKERMEQRLFLAEGVKLCEEATKSGFSTAAVFCAEGDKHLLDGFITPKKYLVSDYLLSKLCEANTPQGIVGVFRLKEEEEDLTAPKSCIVLENIQDPGNFGTILRTAECFGAELVITVGFVPDKYSTKVLRGSMGSALRVKTKHYKTPEELAEFLTQNNIELWAAVLNKDAADITQIDGNKIRAVAIGNEGGGLSKELCDVAKRSLYIPMTGAAESLNAAVAAGVIMWKMYTK